MLTIGDAFDHIGHAVGFDDASGMDPRISPRLVANHAGRFVYGLDAWNFAERMEDTVDVVSGQNTLDLPLGCAEVLAITRTDSWPYASELVPLATLTGYQGVAFSGPPYRFAPFFERDTFTPSGLTLKLRVWGTPDTSATAALTIAFRAEWEDIPDSLDDMNDWALPLPKYGEQFYLSALREIAKGYEIESGGNVEQRLASYAQWPSYIAMRRADARVLSDRGRVQGGAVGEASRYWGPGFGSRSSPFRDPG